MNAEDQAAKRTDKRWRWLLTCSLLVIVALIGWLIYFLATFDINNYRSELETRLSDQFSTPVRIGNISYRVHDISLSLHITDLQAGTDESPLQLTIRQLWLDLLWRSLLQGEIRFSRITLDSPELRTGLGEDLFPANNGKPPETSARALVPALLQTTMVNSLVVKNATVDVYWPAKIAPNQMHLRALNGTLTDFGPDRIGSMTFKGEMQFAEQSSASPFHGQANLDLAALGGNGLPDFSLNLQITALDISALQSSLPETTASIAGQGLADLQLQAQSVPGGAADFQASVQGQNLQVSFGESPWRGRVQQFMASGRWQRDGPHHRIDDLLISLNGSHLAGSATWDSMPPANGLFLLTSGTLTTDTVLRWLSRPPESEQGLLNGLDRTHGEASIDQGRLSYRVAPGQISKTWQLDTLRGTLRDLRWAAPDTTVFQLNEVQLAFDTDRLLLTDGHATIDSTPVAFQGNLDITRQTPGLSGEFDTTITAENILARSGLVMDDLKIEGIVPVHGSLQGTIQDIKLDIQARLHELTLAYGSNLRLEPEANDHLTLNCSLTGDSLNIDHAGIQWSLLEGHFNGQIPLSNPEALQIEGLLTIADLSQIAKLSPVLAKANLRGQADLVINQEGLPTNRRPNLELTVRDVGVSTGKAIADLSRINGRIHITESGFTADRLRVHLGESPLLVTARLDDFKTPVLELQVEARSVRADELIFPSDMNYLYNINGRVIIDGQGIRLDPVSLDLAQGTHPVIHGTVTTTAPVSADLDITAEFANIQEIIALWSEQSPAARKAHEARHVGHSQTEPPRVTIHAKAKTGELYGMHFHDAVGTITPTPGHLVIHPLDFHVGEGFCNAQVLVDTSPGTPSLLRISGHAEDVDALEVYRELLKQKNIVRGRLRGDFYLQGKVGNTYLPTSYGRLNIEIRDGVLHKFQVLSKVFSLLNVSQLFAFQLPDMDTEGMPFNRLTANISLDHGLLHSDDLIIRSDAMNQAYRGDYNLIDKKLDLEMAVNPLGTVDKVVSRLPVAGWLLTGEDQALLTAHFTIKGPVDNVRVMPVPITTLSDKTIGLLRRTFSLPFKLIEDPKILWGGQDNSE